jgi:thiol-disulfide isomerase/thioredoxin
MVAGVGKAAGLVSATLFLLLAIAACDRAEWNEAHEFDRAAAVTRIETRLAQYEAWSERSAALHERQNAREDMAAELEALNAEKPGFADLAADAEQVVQADPADDAAFEAIEVALRDNRMEDMTRWQGSANEARQTRMMRVLLDHHLQRPDFLKVVRLNFDDAQSSDYVVFWKAVFEGSPHRTVRARAARSLMKHYAAQAEKAGLTAELLAALQTQVRDYAEIIRRDYAGIGQLSKEAEGFLASLQHSAGTSLSGVVVATLDGSKDALANYRGKVVLLDFWATWCGACKKDHPRLMKLKQEMAGKSFEIISISVDEKPEQVTQYLSREHKLTWPQWYVGPQGPLLKEWGIQSYPTYLLVGDDGKLEARASTQSLSAILDQARQLVGRIPGT